MTDAPWLSIVTVVRNDRDGLTRTLESVAAQDVSVVEHLIVDGASDDGTAELATAWASRPHVHVVSEPDAGVYDAMNKGWRMASGSHILFLNAGDDFASADSVRMAHGDWTRTGYEWGRYLSQYVDADRMPSRRVDKRPLDPDTFRRGYGGRYHQGAIMSRDLLASLDGFDARLRIVADFELMRRALEAGHRPWEGGTVLTHMDDSGLSVTQWRASLREEFQVVGSRTDYARRLATVAVRRALKQTYLRARRLGRYSGSQS